MKSRLFAKKGVILTILLIVSIFVNIVLFYSVRVAQTKRNEGSLQQVTRNVQTEVSSHYRLGDRFIGLLPPTISSQVPFYGEYLDIDNDGEGEIIFYTVEAMTKPPHVAYIVKDGVIIFRFEGARVSISDRADKSGFVVKEWTLDNFRESSKLSIFSYEKGNIDKIQEKIIKLDE